MFTKTKNKLPNNYERQRSCENIKLYFYTHQPNACDLTVTLTSVYSELKFNLKKIYNFFFLYFLQNINRLETQDMLT